MALACAQIESPGGGPEDKSAPRVLGIYPDSGAVDARPETLSILFSKKMDRRSVRDWIAISPPLEVRSIRWKGERADFILRDRPDSGRTYAILLGAEVRGRRHTSLGPWTAAFSTGPRLDTGRAAGKIRAGKLKPAFAYVYAFAWEDSLPRSEEDLGTPIRIAQADKDGAFQLDYLPRGIPMRIAALYDAARNRNYDEQDDLWASFDQPVVVGDTSRVVSDLEIYMVFPDEPGMVKGSAVDSSCVGRGEDLLKRLGKEADSLATHLKPPGAGRASVVDSILGFGAPPVPDVDTLAIRARLAAIDSLRIPARLDSAQCALPIIVRLFEKDTSMVAEARGKGPFEFRDLAPGVYRLRAFRDENANGQPDSTEMQGGYPHALEILPGRTLDDLLIPLRRAP
jgi:hypothetical protein